MDLLLHTWRQIADDRGTFFTALGVQLQMSVVALAIALLICIPLGVLAARSRVASALAINLFNIARVIPSIAILFLALPYLGLGFKPALVALTVLACPPILINTAVGFRGVDAAVVEAARGMGMAPWQVLLQIEAPLALPVVLAGVRIAAVEVIASATLATYIGGGGLGDYIAQGWSLSDYSLMLAGAIPVALLALLVELGFASLQRALAPA